LRRRKKSRKKSSHLSTKKNPKKLQQPRQGLWALRQLPGRRLPLPRLLAQGHAPGQARDDGIGPSPAVGVWRHPRGEVENYEKRKEVFFSLFEKEKGGKKTSSSSSSCLNFFHSNPPPSISFSPPKQQTKFRTTSAFLYKGGGRARERERSSSKNELFRFVLFCFSVFLTNKKVIKKRVT
jgi:hypothetical protein